MKKHLVIIMASAALMCFTLSCNKDKEDNSQMDGTSIQEHSSDVQDVNNSVDVADDDVNTIMSTSALKSAYIYGLPCNVTIDSSMIAQKMLKLTFNGDNCKGRHTRSGEIDVELTVGNSWKDAGATMVLTYKNFSITRKGTGKTFVFNGSKTFVNVSGGLIKDLGSANTPSTIVHRVSSSDMSITFPGGAQRKWNIARQRSWSLVNGELSLEIAGFGAASNYSNLVSWGTNRRGYEFYTEITSPVISSATCDYNPSAGEMTHYVRNRTIDAVFGVDVSGNPVTTGCPDYFKIIYTGLNGKSTTAIIQY
jgi:hypothetical protein